MFMYSGRRTSKEFKGCCPTCFGDDVEQLFSTVIKVDGLVERVSLWCCLECADNSESELDSSDLEAPRCVTNKFFVDKKGEIIC